MESTKETLKIFKYIDELDCFIVTEEYQQIAEELSYELLFEEARRFNHANKTLVPEEVIEDLEDRIQTIQNGTFNSSLLI